MREEKSKHKILIVDDEKSNLDILRRLFRRKYQVLSAESGEDALDILAEHEVALILSDQRMPGITGAALLERAMQTHPDAIRMILSGFTDTEDLIESIMGLAVSHQIIERHGGEIKAESEIDVGTAFTVSIPLPTPSI